jgi:hypothetical protein
MKKLLEQPLMVATVLQKYYEANYDPNDYPNGVTNVKVLEDLIAYIEKLERVLDHIKNIINDV